MQIPFVGFAPVETSEHMAALGVFGLCQIYAFIQYLRHHMSPNNFAVLFRGNNCQDLVNFCIKIYKEMAYFVKFVIKNKLQITCLYQEW